MMAREFKGGLGPHVNWERREKRRTARAFEERGRGRGRQTDDDNCLEETLSDAPERDDAWNQFDPLDYHAGGWWRDSTETILRIREENELLSV